MSDASIRVVLCDDHALFRRGAALVIGAEPDLEVVGEAESGEGVLDLVRESSPDVVLMDVRMGGMDGIEATTRIVAEFGEAAPKIIVLTTFDLDEAVARSVAAGASGFVLKATDPSLLVGAIRTVHAGNQLFAANATAELIAKYHGASVGDGRARGGARRGAAADRAPGARHEPPPAWETLSEREREIFVLAARGLSNAEIGEVAYVSAGTVKTHISHILHKLGLRDRIQLVVYGYEHGLLPPRTG
ncbi:DNA-binding response regulator [Pseudoclavibacter endophyticus]|uniref:Response regulator transcription factor n=1 Tax=Pseudoclavibacter endophyticus TaxID=1778590 RepID=A0A6H9WQ01_9MICO|nr:response regulator transcription factor [Pseudoclavibacter endophyticus]KAB1648865.1 response regulator transcription factor [Pseudoclavibacter endophyticus]GGA67735.1 DNA-binding response regulator [Pseudoclavibacter endophyticus]